MVSSSAFDPLVWSYVLAGGGIAIYVFFLWLRIRGIYTPSPGALNFIRILCSCLLLTPLAVRYQYSEAAILYLGGGIFMLGLIIKLKRKMGI